MGYEPDVGISLLLGKKSAPVKGKRWVVVGLSGKELASHNDPKRLQERWLEGDGYRVLRRVDFEKENRRREK